MDSSEESVHAKEEKAVFINKESKLKPLPLSILICIKSSLKHIVLQSFVTLGYYTVCMALHFC